MVLQPRLSCVHYPEGVYEPSDDTFLLADAVERELSNRRGALCVEVGTGSGYVAATAARAASFCLGTDINPLAAVAARRTFKSSAAPADAVRCEAVKPLCHRLEEKVDLLAFNPPYVPTPRSEMEWTWEARGWAGGQCGREVMDALAPDMVSLLAPEGVILLVVLDENGPEEVCGMLRELGLSSARVETTKRADEELLHVIKGVRR